MKRDKDPVSEGEALDTLHAMMEEEADRLAEAIRLKDEAAAASARKLLEVLEAVSATILKHGEVVLFVYARLMMGRRR